MRELKTALKVAAGAVLTGSLQEELRKWGWNVVQLGNSWQLFSVPLVDGTVVDRVNGLIEFVSEIQRGVRRDIPGCIIHTLQTRACKRAIKFGNVIGDETAQELVFQLSKCRSPNHCAHGRTVAAPIYDLANPFTQFARVQNSINHFSASDAGSTSRFRECWMFFRVCLIGEGCFQYVKLLSLEITEVSRYQVTISMFRSKSFGFA
jgi:hypothetical protein